MAYVRIVTKYRIQFTIFSVPWRLTILREHALLYYLHTYISIGTRQFFVSPLITNLDYLLLIPLIANMFIFQFRRSANAKK